MAQCCTQQLRHFALVGFNTGFQGDRHPLCPATEPLNLLKPGSYAWFQLRGIRDATALLPKLRHHPRQANKTRQSV